MEVFSFCNAILNKHMYYKSLIFHKVLIIHYALKLAGSNEKLNIDMESTK